VAYNAVIPSYLLDSPHATSAQLDRVAEVADLPNVDLRLIDGWRLTSLSGGFTLLAGPGANGADLATEFGIMGPIYHEGGHVVADFVRLYQHLQGLAMSQEATRRLLKDRK
jgi:hypothetical protein